MAAFLRQVCVRNYFTFSCHSRLRRSPIFNQKLSKFTTLSNSAKNMISWSTGRGFPCWPKPYSHILSSRYMTGDSKGSYLQDVKSSPASALWLGLAGAIPFTSLAALSFTMPTYLESIMHAQCTYGACILTFLGAIHWGYALADDSELRLDWGTLGYSVTPSLVAWSALIIKPEHGLGTVFIGLLYALSKDLSTACFPAWYHALRKTLTALASSSVLLTAVAFYIQ